MSKKSTRPVLVWVISTLVSLVAIWSICLGIYSLAINRSLYPSFQVVFAILGSSAINIVAAISLFKLKKNALILFIISFGLNITSTAIRLITPKGREAFFGVGAEFGTIVEWALLLIICLYSWRLVQKGTLT